MIFYIYNRWGDQIGTLQNVYAAKHKDEVNGEDSLTISFIGDQLIKGNRIVWRDKFLNWHEHTVVDMDVGHIGDQLTTNAYCENSVSELLTDYIVWKKPSGNAYSLLQKALDDSRWEAGTVEISGTYVTSWYHISAFEALQNIIELTGGELSVSLTLSGTQITERRINILSHRGSTTEKRFTYGKNLIDLTRTIDTEDVYTALYGYGKGVPTYDDNNVATGGYTNKITFGKINGGLDYVADEEAKKSWGLPDGSGGIKHTFGKIEFDDCEDPKELLALTKEALKEYSKPRVSYTGTTINLAKAGYTNGEDSQPGDNVFIRDKPLNEKLTGRVLCVERDLFDESNTVITLGNISSTLTDSVRSQKATLDMLKNRSTNWNGVAEANAAWLKEMQSNLNEFMNQTGGYVYWEEGNGITVYDKPREENPTMCIQLLGAGLRIANSKKSNGEWDFKTFGTGDGFTADLINVGTLKCGENIIDLTSGTVTFKEGLIQDLKSGNYWDLATGEIRMASTLTVGGKTVKQIADESASKEVNDFIAGTYDPKIAELQAQIDGQIETFYYDYAPTLSNIPASGWRTEAQRQAHEGDLFFNKTTGYAYRFFKDGSTWKWQLIQDTDVTKALEAASEAQDTADNKRRVFVSQPVPPYDVGDLWTDGTNLYRCKTARASGSYASSHWELATKYVDSDTAKSLATTAASSLTAQQVFNMLTENGTIQGIYMENGNLYFNGTYIRTGDLVGENGSYWNLNGKGFRQFSDAVKWAQTSGTSGGRRYTRQQFRSVGMVMEPDTPFRLGFKNRYVYRYDDGEITDGYPTADLNLSNVLMTLPQDIDWGATIMPTDIPIEVNGIGKSTYNRGSGDYATADRRIRMTFGTPSYDTVSESISISDVNGEFGRIENTPEPRYGTARGIMITKNGSRTTSVGSNNHSYNMPGLIIRDDYVALIFNSTHYIYIDGSSAYLRSGTNVYGYYGSTMPLPLR